MRTFVLSAALLATACASTPGPSAPETEAPGAEAPGAAAPESGSLPDRDPALAKRLIEEQGGILLDVRTPEEFEAGHLDGAVNLSHDQIEAQLAEIEALTGGDKSKPIVTYCGSGKRAGKAKKTLEAAGYTTVTNVGGMSDYPAQ